MSTEALNYMPFIYHEVIRCFFVSRLASSSLRMSVQALDVNTTVLPVNFPSLSLYVSPFADQGN